MKYYCIGIKGAGMSTLAQILSDLGNEVSGYDDSRDYKFTQKNLEERNIPIYYDNEHEIDKDTIVTYSVAFKEDHPEMKRVKSLGLTIKRYNEIVGEITEMFDTISVSGTHGKTTTSSMIKHIFEDTLGCNYFVGAGDGRVSKENNIFVIESDEFNRHFLTYKPNYSVITNIEREHMECYLDLADIVNTFSAFCDHTKKAVVACGDYDSVHQLFTDTEIIYYGFDDSNDIVVKNEKTVDNGENFDIYYHGELFGNFTIPLYGKHMILDSVAAIWIAHIYGIDILQIKNSMLTFKNAKRRFVVEECKDCVIIDDYAHHPTEISATLDSVRRKYPDKRVVAVFKPNTYSRTKDFKDEFVEALSRADKVYLTEIDCNREKQSDYPGVSSSMITDKIDGAEIISEANLGSLAMETNSVVCFMSCAYVDHLIESFKRVI